MSREQREQARRISELVDGLLLHHRYDKGAAGRPVDDGEFRQLRALVQHISEVTVEPPLHFQDDLARRLPSMPESDASGLKIASFWTRLVAPLTICRARIAPVLPPRVMKLLTALPGAALALLAATFMLFRSVVNVPAVSASEIMSRSDASLASLVRPGQLLYRRWQVTSTAIGANGIEGRKVHRMIHEWMDGADFERVAGRWYSGEGDRLLIGYTSVGSGGQRRPNVYFSPGVFGESLGVLNIEPTPEEFKAAVHRFPEAVQQALNLYLDRQYIYLPITGERRFNRAVIETPRQDVSDLPRIVLSLDQSENLNGTPVYRVRVVDHAFIDFNWRSQGPPRVRLASAEIVCYIVRDSYLSVRTEQTLRFEDGRERVTTQELVETRPVRAADLSLDPFKLEVPDGTPVQRQSAFEQLSGVASAFSRLTEFTATLDQGKGRH